MSDAKVALVTGASSGIGGDTARLLQARNFTVYAVAHPIVRLWFHVQYLQGTRERLPLLRRERGRAP